MIGFLIRIIPASIAPHNSSIKNPTRYIDAFARCERKTAAAIQTPPIFLKSNVRRWAIQGCFPLKKKELTPMVKTPNPGVLRALISGPLQNGLRLGENRPLFDRKLLEYLHEQGSGSRRVKTGSGWFSLFPEMIYLESISGSV